MQSFATTVGTSYTLTYYLAGNSDGGPALKTLDVLVGPSALSLTTISSPSFDTSDPLLNHSNMGYLLQSVQFVASSTLTYLEFRSTTLDSSFGPVLDNVDVSVSELPEPASFLLIAGGLALLGLKKLR